MINRARQAFCRFTGTLFFSYQTIAKNIGDTPLHAAVRSCSSADEIEQLIQQLGESSASAMARTVNDNGELPIDLIDNTSVSHQDKARLFKILTPVTIKNNVKKISEPVAASEILGRYHFDPESETYRNLILACAVVNQTRAVLTHSCTHPQTNLYSIATRNTLLEAIVRMRLVSILDPLILMFTRPFHLLFDTTNTIIQKIAERSMDYHLGNCGEFSSVAWHYLKRTAPACPVEFFSVANGDHAFIMIGSGKNKVVCDAWVGDVYLENEIPQKMGCYKKYPSDNASYLNVITSYNPKFHAARPDPELKWHSILCKIEVAWMALQITSFLFDKFKPGPSHSAGQPVTTPRI